MIRVLKTAAALLLLGLSNAEGSSNVNYDAVRADLSKVIREKQCGPILVRLAWHDAGTYDAKTGTGGPKGCMQFPNSEATHGANAGLGIARELLSPVAEKYPEVSTADLWSLAGTLAIKEMGGPNISWRAGRVDAGSEKECAKEGNLPDAQQGCPHLRSVFHRMGLSDQEIVVLSGAHTIGGLHMDRSGHEGDWTARKYNFDNSYFKDLLDEKWTKYENSKGNKQFKSSRDTFMLPSDVALLEDPKMRVWVELYANDQDRFFQDFAAAFSKLVELGVPAFHSSSVTNASKSSSKDEL